MIGRKKETISKEKNSFRKAVIKCNRTTKNQVKTKAN